MIKLAILICGEYRTFDLSYKTFSIFDKLNPDYYFSTWDKSSEIYEDRGINHVVDVTDNTIKEFLPNSTISILNQQFYDNHKLSNTDKMFLHWKNAMKLVLDSGKEYTHIFITRPDIWLYRIDSQELFDFIENNTDDCILNESVISLRAVDCFYMDDKTLLGNFITMKDFVTNIPHFESHVHDALARYTMSRKLWVDGMPINGIPLRSNCRGIENLNTEIVSQKRHQWGK